MFAGFGVLFVCFLAFFLLVWGIFFGSGFVILLLFLGFIGVFGFFGGCFCLFVVVLFCLGGFFFSNLEIQKKNENIIFPAMETNAFQDWGEKLDQF